MPSGAAIPFLGKLLGAAVTRSGSVLFHKIVRRRRIYSAIIAERSLPPPVRQALDDVQVVLGSYTGELTKPLSDFLGELERSGVITAIVEHALTGVNDAEVRKTFNDLHSIFFPGKPDDAKVLFSKLSIALRTSLQESFKDPAGAFLLQSLASQLQANALRTSANLHQHAQRKLDRPDFDSINTTIGRLSKALQGRFKAIRVETNRGSKNIDISKIFVPSKLRYLRQPAFLTSALEDLPQKVGSSTEDYLDLQLATERLEEITYQDLRNSFHRVVVLGDPGGGKSTLCQALCHELAKMSALQSDFADQKNIDAQNQRLPLRVVLRHYEAACSQTPQLSVVEYIVRDLCGCAGALEADDVRNSVRYALSYGRAIIAFDGLDEILDTAKRRDFVSFVEEFSAQFPLCPVIVTSRLVGYRDAPLSDEFEELSLQRFDDREAQTYVTKFLMVLEGSKKEAAAQKANTFMRQTEKNAKDLRQNPLLLGLMAFLFSAKGDVPSNRPEIYKECAELMFEKWDQNRSIRAEIPPDFDMLNLFSNLAFEIYGSPDLEEGVTKEWLRRVVEKYFLDLYESRARAISAAKSVVIFLTGRAWVMSEFGDDVYRFTHRTFLEYFYARHLDQIHESVTDVFQAIRPHIEKNEWDVISHLALQQKAFRNHRRTRETLAVLSQFAEKRHHSAKQTISVLNFCATTLEYLPGAEPDIRGLVKTITSGAIEILQSRNIDPSTLVAVRQCTFACEERREFARQCVSEALVDALSSPTRSEFAIAAEMVSPASNIPSIGSPASGQIVRIPYQLGLSIRTLVRANIKKAAESDPFCARLLWEWYGLFPDSLFHKYGLEMIFAERRAFAAQTNFPAITQMFIRYTRLFRDRDDPDSLRRNLELVHNAQSTLSKFGQLLHLLPPASMSVSDLKKRGVRITSNSHIPDHVWQAQISNASDNADLIGGMLAVLMLETELFERLGTQSDRAEAVGRAALSGKPSTLRKIQNTLRQSNPALLKRYREWKAGDFSFYQ